MHTLFKDKPLITFKRGEVIKLPLKRKKGRVFIEPELASNIIPSEIRPGLRLASVTGELEVKDNVYTIKVITNMCYKLMYLKKYKFYGQDKLIILRHVFL